MVLEITDKILEQRNITIRWSNTTSSIDRFRILAGVHPEALEEFHITQNNTCTGIPLNLDRLSGDNYIRVEGLDSTGTIVDTVAMRVTSNSITNYLRYHRWFEDNFFKSCLQSAAGFEVALVSRRRSGAKCPVCSDPVTGEPGDAQCPNCYGTGYENGFYTPISFWALRGQLTQSSGGENIRKDTRKELMQIVCAPYPRLYSGDYIVDITSHQRYEIIADENRNGQYDLQRLGSITYTAEHLDRHHHFYSHDVSSNLSNITNVDFTDHNIIISGQMLRQRYGKFQCLLQDVSQLDENIVTEVRYNKVLSQVDDRLVISAPEDWLPGTRYRIFINNRIFRGEVNVT